jgi:hypothetical protein
VAEPGLFQEAACRGRVLLSDQDPARQNSDRAFEHAHVLVEDQMGDRSAIQERRHGRNQDGIIGAYQLAQCSPLYGRRRS